MTTTELPELPEPVTTIGPCMFGGEPKVETPVFTAEQMWAFRALPGAGDAERYREVLASVKARGFEFCADLIEAYDKARLAAPGKVSEGMARAYLNAIFDEVSEERFAFHKAAVIRGIEAALAAPGKEGKDK